MGGGDGDGGGEVACAASSPHRINGATTCRTCDARWLERGWLISPRVKITRPSMTPRRPPQARVMSVFAILAIAWWIFAPVLAHLSSEQRHSPSPGDGYEFAFSSAVEFCNSIGSGGAPAPKHPAEHCSVCIFSWMSEHLPAVLSIAVSLLFLVGGVHQRKSCFQADIDVPALVGWKSSWSSQAPPAAARS